MSCGIGHSWDQGQQSPAMPCWPYRVPSPHRKVGPTMSKSLFRSSRIAAVGISMLLLGGATPAMASAASAGGTVASQVEAHARVVHGSRGVTPQSATGCNGVVCIAVCNNSSCTGSGRYVYKVYSDAGPTAFTCAVARFQVNGVVEVDSNVVCGGPYPNTLFEATWYPERDFNNNTQICVYWLSSNNATPGRPCETVYG